MALKFLSAGGSGSTADAVSAVEYATMMGVDLTSNSWGGGGFSQALYDAIAAAGAADQLFVAAAGNGGTNNDVSPHYPSSYDLPNIISVAATDHNDAYASLLQLGRDLGRPRRPRRRSPEHPARQLLRLRLRAPRWPRRTSRASRR